MSSSTTPQTPVDSGECVVCGQVTTTRCSSCASHGTGWMYFCSKEHQKLVWDGHRKVCGKAGNPFRWPALSSYEIELFEAVASQPNPKREGKTWYENKANEMENPAKPGFFSTLGKRSTVPLDEFASRLRSSLIARIREELHWNKVELALLPGNTMKEVIPLVNQDPFGVLLQIELQAWPGFLDRYDEVWWHEFQHRMVLLFTITNDSLGGFMAVLTGKDQTLRYTFAQVKRMCQEVIAKRYPREAEYLLELVEWKCMKAVNAIDEGEKQRGNQ